MSEEFKSQALIDYEAELAAESREQAADERAEVSRISLKAGIIHVDGEPVPGNQIAGMIVGDIFERAYRDKPYQEGAESGPICFALNPKEGLLEPHRIVHEAGQAQSMSGCDNCQFAKFGSAANSKGQACSRKRRIGIVVAGTYSKKGEFTALDADDVEANPVLFMTLPVMSVPNFGTYVKLLDTMHRRPVNAYYTRIFTQPDPKSQFRVHFEPIDATPFELNEVRKAKITECESLIDYPYTLETQDVNHVEEEKY